MLKWTVTGNRSSYTYIAEKKNLILSSANTVLIFHGQYLSYKKSTLPDWIEWVLLHSLSACSDEIFVKLFWKSATNLVFKNILFMVFLVDTSRKLN